MQSSSNAVDEHIERGKQPRTHQPTPHTAEGYARHYKTLILLALPVMFTQAGHMIVQITDNMMVGRIGATSLAASAFAHNVFIGGLLFCIGFGAAMTPFVGAAHGKGDTREAVAWLKNGFVANMLMGLVITALMLFVGLFLENMGQDPEVVRLARPVYVLWVLSILPTMVFVTLKQFAEGLGNTHMAAIITVQEILVNVGANYVLIYGKLGLPALGVLGSGWATLIARISMGITFVVLFVAMPFFAPYRAYISKQFSKQLFSTLERAKLWEYVRLGVPLAGQTILEVSAFALGAIMMGWIGARELASHQIAIGLAALTFMGAMGVAAAGTIKVSQYRGAADRENMRRSAFAAMHIVLAYEFCTAVLFVLFRHWLPTVYVHEVQVIAIAANLLLVAAVFQLVDGLQVVALGALRGIADATVPTYIAFAAYALVALPTSYVCAFVLGWRETGIWIGYLAGLSVASTLFVVRFSRRSRVMTMDVAT